MTDWSGGKRDYNSAKAVSVADGYGVELDGVLLTSPGARQLVVPSLPLAQAMAGEWASHGEAIEPAKMPLSCMAATALDRIEPRLAEMTRLTVMFGTTDLMCYRANGPDELAAREAGEWQPMLDWAAQWLGATLAVTDGVVPVNQSQAVLDGFTRAVEELDLFALTAVSALAAASKSLVIALALKAGHIDAKRAADLALLDDLFQLERWGEDAEARARLERIALDLADGERFLLLLASKA